MSDVGLPAQRLWPRWALATLLVRLSDSMSLVVFLFVGHRIAGSLGAGAVLAGVLTLIAGLAGPLRARRAERDDLVAALSRACWTYSVLLLACVGMITVRAPLWTYYVLMTALGIARAPLPGGLRALLVAVVPQRQLSRATVLDVVGIEVAFVAGPAVASLVFSLGGVLPVLLLMAAATAAAGVLLTALPRMSPPPPGRGLPALAGIRGLLTVTLVAGAALGMFESAIPARVDSLGYAPGWAGILLGLLAAGSAMGGVVVALVPRVLSNDRRTAGMLSITLGVLFFLGVIARSIVPLAALVFVAGLPMTPLHAIGIRTLQRRVPLPRQAEGFALFFAALIVGAGIGQLVTGLLLTAVPPHQLLTAAAAVVGLLGALLASSGRLNLWRPPGVDE